MHAPASLALLVCLLAWAPLLVRADAIGIPDCPPGGTGVPNPRHGTGWCTTAPCTTDADCPVQPGYFGAPSGPRVCRSMGVCVWGDRADAIASCEVDGAACTAPGYPPEGAVCRVRSYCVEASRAPASPTPPAAPASRAPTATTPAESSGMCSLSHSGSPFVWLLALGVLALVRGGTRRE